MTAFLQLALQALLKVLAGTIVSVIQSWQRDNALKDLGYTKAQRDGALKSLQEIDAASAAREHSHDLATRDPASVRRPTGFQRRSSG